VNEASEVITPAAAPTVEIAPESPQKPKTPWGTLLAVPVATAIAIGTHLFVSKEQLPVEVQAYTALLGIVLGLALVASVVQAFWPALRRWMLHMCPIIAGGIVLLTTWEVITVGLKLLPMPYFPGPAGVLLSVVGDRAMIADSAWHSFQLLLGGYALGAFVGLVTGVCIGWFKLARYWGMPVLKIVGPIPATAWVPLAMVVSPNGTTAALGLIAIAVWFPVTMLTLSGISNTRASYLDVAKTLGATPSYLIFRVAIPAAMPSIFIGLFMGLSASFLTLVVAESVGVKSGLGWYVRWKQEWAEYGNVYGAILAMSVFFSTIMTLLFKVRDRVLVWQKGTIKW
jgi:NitT/TauT family transport system permease protein